MLIKIICGQMEIIPGRPDLNYQKISNIIGQAKEKKADILLLPEMCLPGYLIGDLWEQQTFLDDCAYYAQQIAAQAENLCIIFGSVATETGKINEDGRIRKYNAAYICQNGTMLSGYLGRNFIIKNSLPNYREFDDARYFHSLQKLCAEENIAIADALHPIAITINGQQIKLGVMLCEDGWTDNYQYNIPSILAEKEATLLCNLSCSPYSLGKNKKRHRLLAAQSQAASKPLIYCNNVGIQNNGKNIFTYDGSSCVYNASGKLTAALPMFTDELLEFTWNTETNEINSANLPAEPQQETDIIYHTLRYGTQQFLKQCGINKMTIGLSGGIDSAVTAAMYTDILGPENVLLLNLPSRYNSEATKNIAQRLAEKLHTNYAVMPITESCQHTEKQLSYTPITDFSSNSTGLPYRYPKKVEEAAEKISAEITEEDYKEREDFRDVTTFTIDPKDAKDFDDALSIKPLGKDLWEVGVHIADVSHYVTEGSIIDKEAQKRATSVYLVDRTIPMLPERLCNFICSLRPDEEKLAYSAVFNLDADANVKSWRLVHTVIKSNRRFAYEEVQQILEDNGVVEGTGEPAPPAGKDGYKGEFATELITLDMLAKKLRKARFKNGAVKFDREELHFDVDEKGKPTRCYFKKSKDANKLIEEFMLLANRSVAEGVGKVKKGQKAKTLPYRIHDVPDPTKLERLREFIVKFGYKLKTEGTKGEISRSLNKLMDDCNGRREQNVIESVALRAMMKAKYSVHNIGHYGLAFEYYTHFTSPIRRYPDTMVHRLLTRYQNGGRSANKEYYEELCEHSSDMEQIAQNAERDSIKYKMVEFMADKIGNEYPAHISGITSYGIYCEIDENHCEGMVPMHDLDDDYYDFDERNYCLVGRRHHNKYQLGDPIKIKVARANVEKRQLDFTLAEEQ